MARYASGQNQPIRYWNNIPIYLTTILTAVFVITLITVVITSSAGIPLATWLVCPIPLYPAWTLWRLVTHVLITPLSFFTPFSILCFYWWSVGIETHLGRISLTKLLVLIALSGPAVGAVWWWGFGAQSVSVGNYAFTCGLLIAFATLYPAAEAWGWIPFKWLAFACVFCGSLMLLASRDWIELSQLWAACVVGFAYINHAKELEYDDYESPMVRLKQFFRRKPRFRVMPSPRAAATSSYLQRDEAQSEVDALLDKIAKSGLGSLTAKERERLEKASASMRKDQR